MKLAGIFVTSLVVLAAAQAAAGALAILLVIGIVYGALFRRRETFGLLGFCLLAGLIDRHPLICVLSATVLFGAKLLLVKTDESS